MLRELRFPPSWIHGLALACTCMLGLVAIVGSGGGALGFPPCTESWCYNGPPLPPPPEASIQPPHITALVGTTATFTAETANLAGNLSYQWRRSSDGGRTYVDVAGATGTSLSLTGVNLGDDGAEFQVSVRSDNGVRVQAVSTLAVSATPGVVFEDGEFLPADWSVSPLVDPGLPPFVHSEERIASGGNPGAFRRMDFQVPQGAGAARVSYWSRSASYDPAAQGAIRFIDHSEDCIALQGSETTYTESTLLIEQGARRYLSDQYVTPYCVQQTWRAATTRSSLTAQNFVLFDGPACPTGEPCPDFSASGLALRFGYRRLSFGMPGDAVAHGIDNWKVTVWRK